MRGGCAASPVFGKGVQQVVGFEGSWDVVDLNDVAELFRIEVQVKALVDDVVVLGELGADVPRLLQVGLDLTAWVRKEVWKIAAKQTQIRAQSVEFGATGLVLQVFEIARTSLVRVRRIRIL